MTGRGEGLPIEPVWQAAGPARDPVDLRGGLLPPGLAGRYAGELAVPLPSDRPAVIANFVTSLDGVVALGGAEGSGGGEISGFSDPDRFVMALLRGMADAVMIGAGTLRVGRQHVWTAAALQPALAGEIAAWRSELWLAPQPTTIVVTASGNIELTHAGLTHLDVPVIVATTREGAQRLEALPHTSNVRIVATGEGDHVPVGALMEIVAEAGVRLLLCEGGPHLFAELLRARLVDELFLTLAPQTIGRTEASHRLGLVEGLTFGSNGRWASLVSVRRAGDDLFLRYRFEA